VECPLPVGADISRKDAALFKRFCKKWGEKNQGGQIQGVQF
jgi:hypothetical protein